MMTAVVTIKKRKGRVQEAVMRITTPSEPWNSVGIGDREPDGQTLTINSTHSQTVFKTCACLLFVAHSDIFQLLTVIQHITPFPHATNLKQRNSINAGIIIEKN